VSFDVVFGQTAVDRRLLSAEQLASAMASRNGRPLPQILVEQGLLTREASETLLSLFETDVEPRAIPGFELLAAVGRGAMGTVFKARDGAGRPAALKVLSPAWARDRSAAQRFLREAESLRKLDHPGIVKCLASGEADGLLWIAMEFVDGESLLERIKRGPLAEAEALDLAEQVARALDHAHAAGIVHRDLKPANLLLANDGAKLADFGLARDALAPALTSPAAFLGTPYYCSPEQAEGARPDARSDFYSLGATLYHALTGHVPFEGDSAVAVVVKHVSRPVPPPRERRPELSAAIDALVRRLMSKHPGARPQTARELLDDIALVRRGRAPALREGRARRRAVLIAAGLLVPLAIGGAWLAARPAPRRKSFLEDLGNGRFRATYDFVDPDELADWGPGRPAAMPERPTVQGGEMVVGAKEAYWCQVPWTGEVEIRLVAAGEPGLVIVVSIGGTLFKASLAQQATLTINGRATGEPTPLREWRRGERAEIAVVKKERSLQVFWGDRPVLGARLAGVADAPDVVTFGLQGFPDGLRTDGTEGRARYDRVTVSGAVVPSWIRERGGRGP
jgi:predicted Ser/Thr protein kinase